MRLTAEQFQSEFMDEMLGMALMPRPMEEKGYGTCVRARAAKVKDLLTRMYNSLADVKPPAVETPTPQANGKPMQQPARR